MVVANCTDSCHGFTGNTAMTPCPHKQQIYNELATEHASKTKFRKENRSC